MTVEILVANLEFLRHFHLASKFIFLPKYSDFHSTREPLF